jgi:hypothetical protein
MTFIEDAVADYALQYDLYQPPMMIEHHDQELFHALQNCKGCPELPRYDHPDR